MWDRMLELHRICKFQEEEAQVHLHKAEQLAASGKSSLAITEYQAAYALFPSSTITAQIAKLRRDSLGL